MLILKADTTKTVQFGPAVDSTNGVDLEIGLGTAMNNGTTGIHISKNGGTYAARSSTTAPAYDARGMYKVELNATDTDTEGTLQLVYEDSTTCLPIILNLQVVSANTYDSLFSTLNADYLKTDIIQVSGVAEDISTSTEITALNDFNYTTETVSADITKISGSTTSADNLEASTLGIISDSVTTGTSATEITLTTCTQEVDVLVGRIIVVTSGTYAGTARTINSNSSGRVITFDAMEGTLSASDNVVIV